MDLKARKIELEQRRDQAPAPVARFHPNLADLYSQKVANLTDALNIETTRAEASDAIRSLIDEIRLVPGDGKLEIEIFGELAALINLANEHPRSKETGVQVTLVSGAGFVQDPTMLKLRKAV